MTPKVYISSHDKDGAAELAKKFRAAGLLVTSLWHDEPFDKNEGTEDDWAERARRNFQDVFYSDFLVLVSSDGPVTGGKFVEAGVAASPDADVLPVVLGRFENNMVKAFSRFDTADEVIEFIKDTVSDACAD